MCCQNIQKMESTHPLWTNRIKGIVTCFNHRMIKNYCPNFTEISERNNENDPAGVSVSRVDDDPSEEPSYW